MLPRVPALRAQILGVNSCPAPDCSLCPRGGRAPEGSGRPFRLDPAPGTRCCVGRSCPSRRNDQAMGNGSCRRRSRGGHVGDICADPGHASASAGVWGRLRRLASSTIGAGSRCPSVSASSIAVPEPP